MSEFPKGMKQADKAKLEILLQSLSLLSQSGMSVEQISTHFEATIVEIENSSKCRITLVQDEQVIKLVVVDLGGDFVRSRPTSKALNLRARKQGVPIIVTIVEDDKEINLSNNQVADGLQELAEYVRSMPLEIRDVGKGDWPHQLGGMPTNRDDDEGVDGVDDMDEEGALDSASDELAATEETPVVTDDTENSLAPATAATAQEEIPVSALEPSSAIQKEEPPEVKMSSGPVGELPLGGEQV